MADGFTKKYAVSRLVYYESHDEIASAIKREKQIKRWRRACKLRLVEENNPQWRDMWDTVAAP